MDARRPSRWTLLAGGAAVFAVALIPRLCNVAGTYVSDEVIFGGVDAYYHMRRVELAMANHLALPAIDTYLNFPRETLVDWPPGFDAALATVCLVLGPVLPDAVTPGAICAGLIPLLGAATCALVFLLGARLYGLRAGLLAGALLAGVACHIDYTTVGRVDHHAVEPLLLLAALAALGFAARAPASALRHAVIGLVLALLPAFWPGAIAFMVPVAAALAVQAWRGQVGRIAWWTFAVAVAVSSLLALTSPWGQREVLAYYALSWFQPVAFAGAGVVLVAAHLAAPRGRPGSWPTWGPLAAAARASAARGRALPTLRDAVLRAVAYVFTTEAQIGIVHESRPPLSRGLGFLLRWYTPLVLLGPVVLVRAWLERARPGRDPARARLHEAVVWALIVTGPLALVQSRFGPFAAVPAALLIGELLDATARLASRRLRTLGPRATVAATALVSVVLVASVAPSVRPFLRFEPNVLTHLTQGYGALVWLRDEAPPTSHFDDPWAGRPEYGVLSTWVWGHWITYVARKPNVANPLGQTDQNLAGLRDSAAILLAQDEDTAVAFAAEQGIRYALLAPLAGDLEALVRQHDSALEDYVVRDPESGAWTATRAPYHRTLHSRVYLYDGVATLFGDGELVPALQHLRLCYETEPETTVEGRLRPYAVVAEFVPGATLEGRCDAGVVELEVPVETNRGRRFTYARRTPTEPGGAFRVTVPYAARRGPGTTGAASPYRVWCGEAEAELVLTDAQVTTPDAAPVGVRFPEPGGAPVEEDR